MPAKVTPDKKRVFAKRLQDGWSIAESARFAGVSYAWAKAYAKGLKNSSGREYANQREEMEEAGPIPLHEACEAAKETLEDISLFARLYFGAVVVPWQEEATTLVTSLLDTPDEEYLVIDCPPGSGKSTFFTKILPAWLTVKRRHIRGMIGSASISLAKQYVGELRDIFASPVPLSQSPEAIQRGYAVPPERSLVSDFGVFKDPDRKWASEAFFVQQHEGQLFAAKEATWQAYGRGSKFIGNRVDFCIWDDLYDPEDNRTDESKQALRRWYDTYAETRIEPGGLFVLQGQRLEQNDIYRYALDKMTVTLDAEGEETDDRRPKYHHVKFQAHYEDRCAPEHHKASAAPYPEGCVLYPRRLPWSKLRTIRENNPEEYEVVYQQNESAPAGMLVQKIWVKGGIDTATGEEFPGCWDDDRGLCELPPGLTPPLISVATVDPSVANHWAFQWWVVHPASGQRFLMDCVRQKMTAELLLDWLVDEGRWVGITHDWQLRSVLLSNAIGMNVRISHWIIEEVGAFRFLTAFSHTERWMRQHDVTPIPQKTHNNKNGDMGVTSIAPHWKYGRIRLPGKQHDPGRVAAEKLVYEVTRYRLDGRSNGTDDQVMANWFLEWNLPGLLNTLPKPKIILPRPGFVKSGFAPV